MKQSTTTFVFFILFLIMGPALVIPDQMWIPMAQLIDQTITHFRYSQQEAGTAVLIMNLTGYAVGYFILANVIGFMLSIIESPSTRSFIIWIACLFLILISLTKIYNGQNIFYYVNLIRPPGM